MVAFSRSGEGHKQETACSKPTSDGMSIRAVLGHVARLESRAVATSDGWIDIAHACVSLGAARHLLNEGLAAKETLDRLAEIATGREAVHRQLRSERFSLEGMQVDMQARLTRYLTGWRRAAERFTHHTRLLPAQFCRTWPVAPDVDEAHRRWLDERAAALADPRARAAFERARDHCRAAQRRCARAKQEVAQAAEEHQRLVTDVRGGQRPLALSAQALMKHQGHIESLVGAETERTFAQHVMELLIRPVA